MPATITVRGQCTLADAIVAANRDVGVGGCAAGSGADIIRLTRNVRLTTANNRNNGLPEIDSPITIRGNGFSIERTASAPPFRILDILPDGGLTLDGVTIANGDVAGKGGGVRALGPLTLLSSTVTENNATNRGGGIYARLARVTLVNSSVSDNTSRKGAGIAAYEYASLIASDSTISGNRARTRGGGIRLDNALPSTLLNSTVSNNSAANGGGIRATFYSALDVIDSTISNNTARRFDGGGISSGYSALNLDRSRVMGNTATRGGGIFTGNGYSDITLQDSTISGNTARESGGGAFFAPFTGDLRIRVRNSTFSGNTAETGGGIFEYAIYYRHESAILHSTITGNTATQGGGIYAINASRQYHTLASSIVANNEGGNCAGPGLTVENNNFDDDGSCSGATAITAGVDFDTTLADNGGPTPTHALLEGSVATDAAGDCFLPTDQRLFRRDDSCDSGSFELGAEATTVSASVTGLAVESIFCKNTTTGQTGRAATSRSSWLCQDLGVEASTTDRIRISSTGIADGIFSVGGSVNGLTETPNPRVICRNRTTGRRVVFGLTSPSWSCEAQGLAVNLGDTVQQVVKGRT